jgi:transposase
MERNLIGWFEGSTRELRQKGISVRVGLEATGYSRWFERLLAELGIEVWIGDAAEIKTKRVRKQKADREDAKLLLQLLLENRFPRIWAPSPENRDLRQLLWHRHRLVQMRTRIMNQLQALAGYPTSMIVRRIVGSTGLVLANRLSLIDILLGEPYRHLECLLKNSVPWYRHLSRRTPVASKLVRGRLKHIGC